MKILRPRHGNGGRRNSRYPVFPAQTRDGDMPISGIAMGARVRLPPPPMLCSELCKNLTSVKRQV